MSTTTLSLFDELTGLTHSGFPVTQLLTRLLQAIGHDVCLAKRNLHSSYWTVSSARNICDFINRLAATAGDGDSWDDFNKYTEMLIWLEKWVLDHAPAP